MTLVVTPGKCWLPPALAEGRRLWGIAAQLYLLRSATDWGIGDFGDLRRLVELAADHGADVIGLNPLHAMFPDDPEHASPYSPASRLLLNILNIDVTAVPELRHCPERQGPDRLRGLPAGACKLAVRSTWWITPRSPRSSSLSWKSCSTSCRGSRRSCTLARLRGVPARARRGAGAQLPVSGAARAFRARRSVPCRLARLARGIPRPGLARRRALRQGEPAIAGFHRMAAMGR